MRLLLAIVMLGTGVWLGVKVERFMQMDRCLDAGGSFGARGFCSGVEPNE